MMATTFDPLCIPNNSFFKKCPKDYEIVIDPKYTYCIRKCSKENIDK
jgi:hypothetical protein